MPDALGKHTAEEFKFICQPFMLFRPLGSLAGIGVVAAERDLAFLLAFQRTPFQRLTNIRFNRNLLRKQ